MSKAKGLLNLLEANDRIWLRLGDQGDYEDFEDLQDLAEYLHNYSDVTKVQSWVDGGLGFTAEGYTGHNYISLFWVDSDAQLTRGLTAQEKKTFEKLVRSK